MFPVLLIALAFSSQCVAAQRQTFEKSDGPLWQVDAIQSDCSIEQTSWNQKNIRGTAESAAYDEFSFIAGIGKQLLVHRHTASAFIIPELTASVRVKSSREGARLSARVVLPHSLKSDGTPISIELDGPTSRRRDVWEKLEFSGDRSLRELLQSRQTFLRSKYHREISLRDAYLDRLTVNIYTGRGKSQICVEDLKLDGVVGAERVSRQFEKTPESPIHRKRC